MAPSFNAGPRPVIYYNETYYYGSYTNFSKIIPASGIRFDSIVTITTDSACNISNTNLNGAVVIYEYIGNCDLGQLALDVQANGAIAFWISSDYTVLNGTIGALIPTFRVDRMLASQVFANHATVPGAMYHTKVPIYGDYRNNYRMLTVRCWGENPYGRWELKLADTTAGDNGLLEDWYLEFFGTLQRVVDPVTQIDFFGASSSVQPSWFVAFFVLLAVWVLA